jgi:hypothetical protein
LLPLQENETALLARGYLDLIVKQQTGIRFDVKLTPMGTAPCPYLCYLPEKVL